MLARPLLAALLVAAPAFASTPAEDRMRGYDQAAIEAEFTVPGIKTDQASVQAARQARCQGDPHCEGEFDRAVEHYRKTWLSARSLSWPTGGIVRELRAATKAGVTDWLLAYDQADARASTARASTGTRDDLRRRCEQLLSVMEEPVRSSTVAIEGCMRQEAEAARRIGN